MNTFSISSFIELLDELIIGKHKEYTWIIDREPGHGILGTINQLSAAEASKAVREGGSTVAAHTEHVRWSLQFALSFLEGKNPEPNWDESWRIKTVTDSAWPEIQKNLRDVYQAIRKNVEDRKDWTGADTMMITGLLAVLPHLGYHLGAIKQMIIALEQTKK